MPNKPVIEGVTYDSLSEDDKRKTLDAINIIEVKRGGRVKG